MDLNLANLATWYVAFLLSVTAHEAAHALAALKGGDPTAYLGGQVSLNPVPHIRRSPVGTVVVPLLSYLFGGWMIGWASAPYDPYWAERYPRRAAWMAAAGPAANLILATLAFLLMKLGLAAGVFVAPESIGYLSVVVSDGTFSIGVARLLSVLFTLNLILFLFNLFPVPPLDGSSVITLLLPEDWVRKYRALMQQPAFSLLGLVLAWRFFPAAWRVLFLQAIKLVHPEGDWGYYP